MEALNTPMVRKSAVAVLVLLAVFLGAKTVSELVGISYIGQDKPVQHTISVQGEGTVTVAPDTAEFSFAVVEEQPRVSDAQEMATQKINDAIDFLKEQGIAEGDIKTSGYSVSPRYDYIRSVCREGLCPPGQRQLRGFEVRQTVEVRTDNLDAAGQLFSGLGEIGVQQLSSLRFTVEDEDAIRQQARDEAIEEAKAKAERLAEQLGVKLGRVVSFNESGGPRPYQERAFAADAGAGGGVAPQIPVGENEITANVSVTYEIK